MSNFSTALSEIVKRSFDGKWAKLAEKSGVDPSVISRLGAGKFEPSIERLQMICEALHRNDCKQLLLAAARDRVPEKFQSEIFGDEDPASQILRSRLSPDIAAVIRYLESTAMSDPLTASYLRRIGEWVGIMPGVSSGRELKVADDIAEYKVTPKTGNGRTSGE